MDDINENYWWWIKSLNEVIFDFADVPENVLKRVGEKISIPDDLMNDLDHWFKVTKENNISLQPELSALVTEIFAISNKYDGHESEFWTNQDFCKHPNWVDIRNKSRNYVVSKN